MVVQWLALWSHASRVVGLLVLPVFVWVSCWHSSFLKSKDELVSLNEAYDVALCPALDWHCPRCLSLVPCVSYGECDSYDLALVTQLMENAG